MLRKYPLLSFTLCFLWVILSSGCSSSSQTIRLSALFTDQMVLQQNTRAAIWGTATPLTNLRVNGSWGEEARARANEEGYWITYLSTPAAGGPFELSIEGSDTSITIREVLVGEVWLCSGQSNMEMPLEGWPPADPIRNSEQHIREADVPMIRMFTVPRTIAVEPAVELRGEWVPCSPQTAGSFSATAYFFGRSLYDSLRVPVGLIHSSWGGTPAEAWTAGKSLAGLEDFRNVPEQLMKAAPQNEALKKWLEQKESIELPDTPEEEGWMQLDFRDAEQLASGDFSQWPKMRLPAMWEAAGLGGFDGVVLFKKEVIIPEQVADTDWVLELGPIDDMDDTYLNGKKIGGMLGPGFWNVDRSYTIPAGMVQSGKNILAVRVVDYGGGGGLYGAASSFRMYPKGSPADAVPLAGEWSYLPLAEYNNQRFYLYGGDLAAYRARPEVEMELNSGTPAVLYNGMIAPLVPYTLKGAIWYQGESNVGRAAQYASLFPTLIGSWRQQWRQEEFPFYYVQIAPFHYGDPAGRASARLREAQRKALSTSNTGMVVTLDIGDIDNIHPANKEEVGRRLALWALARNYVSKGLVCSGPLFKEMQVVDDQVIVSFDNTGNGLKSGEGGLTGFEIAGEDGQFLEAQASISGSEVILSHPAIRNPKNVRYAFRNDSEASLFNEEGLPASGFTTEEL